MWGQFNFIDLQQYIFIMLSIETINGRSNMAYKYDGKYISENGRRFFEFDGKYIKQNGRRLYEFDGKYIKKTGRRIYEITERGIRNSSGRIIEKYENLGEAFITILKFEGLL